MLLRNIERKPLASILSIVAIAFAVAILVVGRSTLDAVSWMVAVQFQYVSREDATLTFVRALKSSARLELPALPGVLESEPYRVVLARISSGHRSRRLAIVGLPPDPQLHRIVDRDLNVADPPRQGVLLTTALANLLRVKPGDAVTITFLEGQRRVVQLPVQGEADELIGLNAYIQLDQLNALLNEDRSISGAYVRLDPNRTALFDKTIKATPKVAGISFRQSALDEFQRSFAESIGISAVFILGFAFVIAFGAVYNAGRVALSERLRELSTLRILGYSLPDVTLMLVGEQAALMIVAIPAGFLIGNALNRGLQPLYELEYYRVPIIVSNETYLFAASFVLLAAAISWLLLGLQIRKLDMVTALKAGE